MPLIDEKVQTVGREVQELARLHRELAQAELRDGVRRIVAAVFLFGVGILVSGLAMLSAGIAVFYFLDLFVGRPLAAALVALLYLLLALAAYLIAYRRLEGSRSLLLPRTRAMLKELFKWPDEPMNS